MCDAAEDYDKPLNERPLFFQRFHGWFEPVPPEGGRHRLIHRAPNGRYTIGRHDTFIKNAIYRDDIYCVWFGWSPYPQVKNRKLQIRPKMSTTRDDNLGLEHKVASEEIDHVFREKSATTECLLAKYPQYAQELDLVRQHLYQDEI